MLKIVISGSHDPYQNLALEDYLFSHCKGEIILYLWQNEGTVVIGRWQDAYRECNLAAMQSAGVKLARRRTGGGAVYHHLGNLNFTIIAEEALYSVPRQLDIIIRALAHFGINAQKTGRNDLVLGGKKFSGNAFRSSRGIKLHHGTILINEDTSAMEQFLNVSQKKLASKGVKSVKSRVINLSEINPQINVLDVATALAEEFSLEFPPAEWLCVSPREYASSAELLASEKWLFGENPPFEIEFYERLSFGEITLRLNVSDSRICAVKVFTDSLDTDLPPLLETLLLGCEYNTLGILNRTNLTNSLEAKEVAHFLAKQI